MDNSSIFQIIEDWKIDNLDKSIFRYALDTELEVCDSEAQGREERAVIKSESKQHIGCTKPCRG